MELEEKLIIHQDTLELSFKEHLSREDNYRILFSGPFGQGKTTFLNSVFDTEKEKYITIKLFPVNYAVSSNEDVFELIKFDILTQLVGNYSEQLNLKKVDFSRLLTTQILLRDNFSFFPWLEMLLTQFGAIGKSASEFIKILKATVGDLNEFHKQIQIDETQKLEDYVDRILAKPGSAYEMDVISSSIKDFICRLRVNSNKSIVLLIDDLDRLDPDHIFRLFNVFSTQFEHLGDSNNGYNKFGFDKIIFVCDIENIYKIYTHKYGRGVDFKGYLDKFYTQEPFDFNNRDFVRNHIRQIIDLIKTDHGSQSVKFYNVKVVTNEGTNFQIMLEWLLISLLNNRFLNLRSLLQVNNYRLDDIPLAINRSGLNTGFYPIVIILQILLKYYPTLDLLKEKLDESAILFDNKRKNLRDKININSDITRLYEYIISIAIPFITDPNEMVTDHWKRSPPDFIHCPHLNCYIHFEAKEPLSTGVVEYKFKKATQQFDDEESIELNPYEVISKTLWVLKKMGILH